MNYETIYPATSELLIHSGNNFGIPWHMFFTKENLKTGHVAICGIDRTYTGLLIFMQKTVDENSYTMKNAIVKKLSSDEIIKAKFDNILQRIYVNVEEKVAAELKVKEMPDPYVDFIEMLMRDAKRSMWYDDWLEFNK